MPKQFKSFAALRAHTSVVAIELEEAASLGISAASHELLHETRELIGHYQRAAGPYPDWAPLAESTKADRMRLGYPSDQPELVTSELRDSYEVRTQGLQGGLGSSLPQALSQEVGNPAKNLPARPILGFAFVRGEKKAFAAFLAPIALLLRK